MAPRWNILNLARVAGAVWLAGVALLGQVACEESQGPEGRERVVIQGETFWLEPALDADTRNKGLGGRTEIDAHGGMVFTFTQAMQLYFVMRDCLVDIDIAFLDGTGRVTAIHEMPIEEPQREDESDLDYENRLVRYPSKFSAQFVIEVASGTLKRLGLKNGDLVELDTVSLKARAR